MGPMETIRPKVFPSPPWTWRVAPRVTSIPILRPLMSHAPSADSCQEPRWSRYRPAERELVRPLGAAHGRRSLVGLDAADGYVERIAGHEIEVRQSPAEPQRLHVDVGEAGQRGVDRRAAGRAREPGDRNGGGDADVGGESRQAIAEAGADGVAEADDWKRPARARHADRRAGSNRRLRPGHRRRGRYPAEPRPEARAHRGACGQTPARRSPARRRRAPPQPRRASRRADTHASSRVAWRAFINLSRSGHDIYSGVHLSAGNRHRDGPLSAGHGHCIHLQRLCGR